MASSVKEYLLPDKRYERVLRRRIFEKILQINSNDLDIAAKSFTLKPLTRFTELKILGLYNSKITAPNDKF